MIYNPTAGRGRAKKWIDESRRQLAPHAQLLPTDGPGHAIEVAKEAIARGFERIIAAGGDGTVHEVANGILETNHPDAFLSVWPLGSMNDYAFTLGLSDWWKFSEKPPLEKMSVDVGRAQAGDKTMWFINSAGVGFNGMVTIESRKIRWLRGIPLYAWGLIKAMVKHYAAPTMKIQIGDHEEISPVLMLGVYLGQREGGFPIGKNAKLDDGQFDTFRAANVWRWELIRHLPGLISGNLPNDHPKLSRGRGPNISIQGDRPLCCHLDGEFLCKPEDGEKRIEFEVVKQRLIVEYYPPRLYGGFSQAI